MLLAGDGTTAGLPGMVVELGRVLPGFILVKGSLPGTMSIFLKALFANIYKGETHIRRVLELQSGPVLLIKEWFQGLNNAFRF